MNLHPVNEEFQKELGKGLAVRTLRILDTLLLLVVAILGILYRDNPKVLWLLLVVAAGLLLLLLLPFVLLSSRKKVVDPKAVVRHAPTPQDIRRQEAIDAAEFARQFPKPDTICFEVLKWLAMNPRDGSLDAQGVACLFYEGRVTRARPCLKELLDFGYIQRAGPAMPGEGNNHYQISQKGITCVNIHAA